VSSRIRIFIAAVLAVVATVVGGVGIASATEPQQSPTSDASVTTEAPTTTQRPRQEENDEDVPDSEETTTTVAPTTEAPTTVPEPATSVDPVPTAAVAPAATPRDLPVTGSSSMLLALAAGLLIVAGGLVLGLRRSAGSEV
jgi:LPXTG-motif cell wall-anchored protein